MTVLPSEREEQKLKEDMKVERDSEKVLRYMN